MTPQALRLIIIPLAALALSLPACSSLGDSDGNGPLIIDENNTSGTNNTTGTANNTTGTANNTSGMNNTTGDPSGPKILEVSPTAPSISGERDSVTFTVVVTDPDGASDLLGGLVRDGITGETIVSMTRTGEGTYTAEVTWEALHAQAPIEFEGSGQRVVLLEFIDAAEHRTRQSVTIALSCPSASDRACGGRCRDICLTLGEACVPGQAPDLCTCTNSANLTDNPNGLASHACTLTASNSACENAQEIGRDTLCPGGGPIGCMINAATQSVFAVCGCTGDDDCPATQRCVASPDNQPLLSFDRLCVARAQ